jgi:hypothetical protein
VRAAVRLQCTQEPALKEVPVSETGLFVSTEVKRRATTGGGALLVRRFASFAPKNRHARCMTCGPGSPCQRLGRWWRRR